MLQSQLIDQLLHLLSALVPGDRLRFQHREDVLLDSKLAKHRCFLGEITDSVLACPQIHGHICYIFIDDEDITDVPMYLRARQYGISYLPQEASVFRKLTVEENILAVLEAQPISWHERREKMEKLIDQLGLEHIRLNRGYALSGGERRRVEIARALCINPKFILLDEPFSGIDPIAVLDLQKIISNMKAAGIGVLITDHNVRETLSVTDRAYIINEGKIFRHGTPEQLGNDSEVRRVYLGESFSLV